MTGAAGAQTLTTLTGTELLVVDNGGAVITQAALTTIQAMVVSGRQAILKTNSTAVSANLTAGNIADGSAFVALSLTGNPAGAANITLPTVNTLVAQFANPLAGQSYVVRIINSANSNTWTVLTNTGWTLSGTMTIATGTWRDFIVSFTSLTAATFTNVGGGTVI